MIDRETETEKMNRKTLEELIRIYRDDPELTEAIQDTFLSFEEYHTAIYSMEIRKKILSGAADAAQYREEISGMDRTRTNRHNAVLANVSMLNRMAEQAGLPPVYDGIVSEERPYRRQVADAVLAYVRDVILERP